MALITTLAEFNKYVMVSSDFDDEKFLKYTSMADRNIVKIIGQEKFEEIVDSDEDDPIRKLLSEYSANMGLSYALPAFVLNITNFGVFTNATSDSQRAEWWQIKDLNRSLLKFAFSAMDDALQVIGIENTELLRDLFVFSVKQFESVFSIAGSTQTFISMIPFLREVQDMYLIATLGDCAGYDFEEAQLKIIRAAVVNLALSHAAVSGSFSIESNAIVLRLEVMPWEKIEKVEQVSLDRFREARYNIGMGYLTKIQELIKTLPCYQEKEFVSKIQKKQSGLFL